jgi:hypothetical protein
MRQRFPIAACAIGLGAVALSTAFAAVVATVDPSAGPSGTHVQNGSLQPACTVSGLSVSCNAYQLGGVGNTNAVALLSVSYSATVECTNKGGQLVEVKSHPKVGDTSGNLTPSRNGVLRVPQLGASVSNQLILSNAEECPNGNWRAAVKEGTVSFTFTYTLNFDGFDGTYLTITGP